MSQTAPVALDEVNRAIVHLLQEDGRRSYADIAKRVNRSEASVRQRVSRLMRAGVIQIVAITDQLQMGYQRAAMIAIRVVGDVEGRVCVLVDDRIDTGGTIVQAAEALMADGAEDVVIVATHAVFSGPAVDRLKNSTAFEVIVTNTLPLSDDQRFDKLTVLSIAPLLAQATAAVFEDGSVTSLFKN